MDCGNSGRGFAMIVASLVVALVCMLPTMSVAESFFHGGDRVEIVDTVKGDAVVVGRNITIDADIEGDLNAMGASITVNRDVDGAVRVVGQDIRINGEIDDDLSAYGRRIVLGVDAELDADAEFSGGDVVLMGRVEGDLLVQGARILLNGRVDGDVTVKADALEIGPDAVLRGEVLYEGETPAVIDPLATLSEGLSWEGGSWSRELFDDGVLDEYSWQFGDSEGVVHAYRGVIGRGLSGGMLLVLILTGGLATLALPTASAEVLAVARDTPAKAFGVGLLLLLFMPLAGIVVLSTVLGFVVGLFLLLVYLALLIVGLVAAMMAMGGWMISWFGGGSKGGVLRLVEIVLGAAILFVLARLPVVAMPAFALVLAFGVGLATLSLNRRVAARPGAAAGTTVAQAPGADISTER